jgi:hypothetical protein
VVLVQLFCRFGAVILARYTCRAAPACLLRAAQGRRDGVNHARTDMPLDLAARLHEPVHAHTGWRPVA